MVAGPSALSRSQLAASVARKLFNTCSSATEGNVGWHERAAQGTLWWHFRIR